MFRPEFFWHIIGKRRFQNRQIMKSLRLLLIAFTFLSTASVANAHPKKEDNGKVKIVAPVYEAFRDCDLTYYRTRIHGESVLVDNKGRLVKYLCDSEEAKSGLPVIFKVILVPVTLLTGF